MRDSSRPRTARKQEEREGRVNRRNPMTDEDMNDPVKRAAYIARLTEAEAETEEEEKKTARLQTSVARMLAKERICVHKLGPLSRGFKRYGFHWECVKCRKFFKRKSVRTGPKSLGL